MLTDQDLIISRSLLILIGSFIIFSAVGVMHPQDHSKYKRYRLAENYEMPRTKRF
jgi:hypothetical protein